MRILWSSNAIHSPSGYGVQGRYLIPRLIEMGHEVAIFSWYGTEGGIVDLPVKHPTKDIEYRVRHYPRFFDPIGNDVILAHAENWQADLVVTLVDSWVLNTEVHAQLAAQGKWAQWSPVDHDIIPPAVMERYRVPGTKVLPYSRHAEKLMREAGIPDVRYLPHGVETGIYKPFTHVGAEYNPAEARRIAKQQLGFDPECFLVGMVGANKGWPPRKGFPEAFQIVNQFRQRHPDTRFYVHAHTSQAIGGLDLVQLGMESGISDIVRYPDQYQHMLGFPDQFLALIYNAFDVMIQPSYGEGFGLPIIEAQACGTPVIVNDCTAMTELAGPGWKVAPMAKFYDAPQKANWHLPSIPGFVDALEEAYQRREDYTLREQARVFAQGYDWEVVASQYWKPFLDHEAETRGLARPGERPGGNPFQQTEPVAEPAAENVVTPEQWARFNAGHTFDCPVEIFDGAMESGCTCPKSATGGASSFGAEPWTAGRDSHPTLTAEQVAESLKASAPEAKEAEVMEKIGLDLEVPRRVLPLLAAERGMGPRNRQERRASR